MQIRRHRSPEEFHAYCREVLESQEGHNDLMIGLVDQLTAETAETRENALLYSFSYEEIHGNGHGHVHSHASPPFFFAIQTDARRGMVISSTDAMQAESLFPIMACLRGMHPETAGVVGPRELTEAFARGWKPDPKLNFRQLLYRCEQVVHPAKPAAGRMRRPVEADLAVLAPWVKAFLMESLHDNISDEAAATQAEQRFRTGNMWVWDNGGIASMLQMLRETRRGCTVGFVYTPPEHRKHGYASCLVAQATQHALDNGRGYVILFTDEDFATSNKIYQDIGYQQVGKFINYRFD